MEMDTDLITMQEAATICRLKGVFAIRKAIRRRELPAFRISHRHVLIPRAAFYKWMESRKVRSIGKNNQAAE
jgi:excisionase family DNA binding protein